MATDVDFNISHSGDIVLLALGRQMHLGVDVEQLRDMKRRDQIARGILSESELGDYLALPESRRQSAFFRIWTRKEAIVKAVGRGLSFPLTQVEVSAEQGDVRLRRFGEWFADHSDAPQPPWYLRNLSIGRDYAGALATNVVPKDVHAFAWTPGDV